MIALSISTLPTVTSVETVFKQLNNIISHMWVESSPLCSMRMWLFEDQLCMFDAGQTIRVLSSFSVWDVCPN